MAFECHAALAKTIYRGADYRVFHMIMPSIHDGSLVWINQTSLAKELAMPVSNVSRSIKRLIEAGVIERLETASGRTYRLNPNFAWYGPDNGEHTAAVKEWSVQRIQ